MPDRPEAHPLERYTVDTLLPPAARILVMRHRVRQITIHWHDFYELVFVRGGHGRHVVNGVVYEVSRGSAFLLTPADFHELVTTTSDPLVYDNVVIDPWLVDNGIEGAVPPASGRGPWRVDDWSDEWADFARLRRESQTSEPGAAAMVDALLRCILIEFFRRCSSTGEHQTAARSAAAAPAIQRAVVFVDHHFREPLTLADVAAQVHLSPNYVSERFREFTGISFQTYLQQRRLRFARSLLAATRLGVTEVCHAAGFNSLSHFGRAYRRRYGESPSTFRGLRTAGGVGTGPGRSPGAAANMVGDEPARRPA